LTKKGEIRIKIIAERLKEARNEKAKTQSDLAELLNISRAAFGEYERGNNLPPIDKLVIIARELEVSIDWLAGIAPENQINLNQIRQAVLQIATGTETIMKAVENK
jgi:transcriptional regulator with XRE-family HTH domain